MNRRAAISTLFFIGLAALPALAGDQSASKEGIAPFEAHYRASFNIGLSMSGSAVRKLSVSQDQWRLSQDADSMVATIRESSQFTLSDQQLIPQRYEYLRKILGKKRHALLSFDWQQQQVTNNVQDRPWKLAIQPGTLDKLNYQLQLRMDMRMGRETLEYRVADGGLTKHYRFRRDGEEQLETPIGQLDTIRVMRVRENSNKQTLIWFAPELDYLIVKIAQTDSKGKTSTLLIDRLANRDS